MANKKLKRACEEDSQHLLGVPPHFASQVDLILWTDDADVSYAFPVHKQIISAYSQVLGQVLFDDLQPAGRKVSTQQLSTRALPGLPMLQDDSSALRGVLTRIYSVYHEKGRVPDSGKAAADVSLRTLPALIQQMMLAHKYSMTNIVSDIEVIVLEELWRILNQSLQESKEEPEMIMECHIATEQLTSTTVNSTLQDMCETIIAADLQLFSDQRYAIDSKLSATSILRVAKKAVQLESRKAEVMRASFYTCVVEARELSHASNLFIADEVDFKQGIKSCPMCSGRLRSVIKCGDAEIGLPDQVVVEHCHDTPCSIGCIWPQAVPEFRLQVKEPLHVQDFEGVQERYAAYSSNAALKAGMSKDIMQVLKFLY